MNSSKIVRDWEIRLATVGKRMSDICRDCKINPSVISNWKKRDAQFEEISVILELEKEVQFSKMAEIIKAKTTQSTNLNIWCRGELQLSKYELAHETEKTQAHA